MRENLNPRSVPETEVKILRVMAHWDANVAWVRLPDPASYVG